MSSFRCVIFLFLLSALQSLIFCQDTATLSICSEPAYSTLRACAQGCLGCSDLAGDLSCWVNNQALDSCFCRADLIPVAESILSSCVASQCSSNTVDVGEVLGLYVSYCSNTGTPPTPISLTITTTENAQPTAAPTLIVISTATVTDSGPIATVTEFSSGYTVETSASEYGLLLMCAVVRDRTLISDLLLTTTAQALVSGLSLLLL
jgi:hypothetical protein